MNKKLILNLITLTITSVLLIVTMFSWYVSNKEVTASGITGKTVAYSPLVKSVNIYSFSKREGNVFTIDGEPELDDDGIVMAYNPNYALDTTIKPSLKLIELELLDGGVDLEQIKISTSITHFIGYNHSNHWVTDADVLSGLSLSSVIKFLALDSSEVVFNNDNDNNKKITFTNYNSYNYNSYTFDDSATENVGKIDDKNINLLNEIKRGITKIYILVDFNDEYIDKLFSANLGNSAMDIVLYNDSLKLIFIKDFVFYVSGSEVEI